MRPSVTVHWKPRVFLWELGFKWELLDVRVVQGSFHGDAVRKMEAFCIINSKSGTRLYTMGTVIHGLFYGGVVRKIHREGWENGQHYLGLLMQRARWESDGNWRE